MNNAAAISYRALVQRINRALRTDFRVLRKSRSWRERSNLGAFHIVDTYRNVVVALNVNPEVLALDLGVMRPSERIIDDGRLAA